MIDGSSTNKLNRHKIPAEFGQRQHRNLMEFSRNSEILPILDLSLVLFRWHSNFNNKFNNKISEYSCESIRFYTLQPPGHCLYYRDKILVNLVTINIQVINSIFCLINRNVQETTKSSPIPCHKCIYVNILPIRIPMKRRVWWTVFAFCVFGRVTIIPISSTL